MLTFLPRTSIGCFGQRALCSDSPAKLSTLHSLEIGAPRGDRSRKARNVHERAVRLWFLIPTASPSHRRRRWRSEHSARHQFLDRIYRRQDGGSARFPADPKSARSIPIHRAALVKMKTDTSNSLSRNVRLGSSSNTTFHRCRYPLRIHAQSIPIRGVYKGNKGRTRRRQQQWHHIIGLFRTLFFSIYTRNISMSPFTRTSVFRVYEC